MATKTTKTTTKVKRNEDNSLSSLREKLKKQKEEGMKKKTGDLSGDMISTSDIQPGAEGKIKIRILPPIKDEDPFFYRTHSYNYLEKIGPDGTDVVLFSAKKLKDNNGKLVFNPIDELVKQIYKSGDETLIKNIASKSKRKRRFYFNAIFLEEGKEPRFVIFSDNTNRGEVTSKICELMAVDFARDTEDSWFDENIVPSDDPIDLLSIEEGYDISITKIKNGKDNWDVTYKVVPSRAPRALSEKEIELLDKRVELTNIITYETSLEKVNEYLRKLTGDDEEVVVETKRTTVKKNSSLDEINDDELEESLKDVEKIEETSETEEDMEEVLNLLDDNDKSSKPKKKKASSKKKK